MKNTGESSKERLTSVVSDILHESNKQITFLIKNSDELCKLSGGMVNISRISSFREGITTVYLANQNVGILENVSLSLIFELLDNGVVNEKFLDMMVESIKEESEYLNTHIK